MLSASLNKTFLSLCMFQTFAACVQMTVNQVALSCMTNASVIVSTTGMDTTAVRFQLHIAGGEGWGLFGVYCLLRALMGGHCLVFTVY